VTELDIRDLFTIWQGRLGLAEWRIRIDFEAIDPETVTMQVHKCRNYQRATVKVQPWVLTNSPPEDWQAAIGAVSDLDIEEAVVHELLHCCTDTLWQWAELLRPETHVDALDTAVRAWEAAEESVVDKLAIALVAAWTRLE
jgi:hypothetical protein